MRISGVLELLLCSLKLLDDAGRNGYFSLILVLLPHVRTPHHLGGCRRQMVRLSAQIIRFAESGGRQRGLGLGILFDACLVSCLDLLDLEIAEC